MAKQDSDGLLDEQLNRMSAGLIKYLDRQFAELSGRMDRMESRMSTLEGGVDQVLKNQETAEQERLVSNRQVSRHEDWIEQASPVVGISYDAAA